MPELPEVETIKLGLTKYLVGHRIESVEVKLPKIIEGNVKAITGTKVISIDRAGKGLLINLNNGYSLAIHIKLTGQLIYTGPDRPKDMVVSKDKVGTIPNKFTHVIFHLDKDGVLYYNDLRQFGWIKIIKTDEVKNLSFFKELGPEPPVVVYSSSDPSTDGESRSSRQARTVLNEELFTTILSKSNLAVKVLLMDQKKIGGIGNIYANDALWDSKIDPKRRAKELSKEEIHNLYESILKVLKKGLESGGASELNFVNALGVEGGYQKHFLVYGQQGKPCKHNDGGTIEKYMLGGRGTYWCASCQK